MINLHSHRRQSGQAIPLLAILLTVLLGALGLAIDSGRSYLDRRTLQNATDAAVLATADNFENGSNVTAAEQAATTLFKKDMQINGGISGSPTWCTTPTPASPPPTCSVTITFDSNPHTLTLGYVDRRAIGKGLVFTGTGSDVLPLAFMQVLHAGNSVNISADAQTVVYDQSQNPAILVTGTSCAPQASLSVSGGLTVTVVGAVYSDGGMTTAGSSSINVQGNVYSSCSQSQPGGMNISSGYTYYSPVGKLAVNYLGGVNSPYFPYYSGHDETWPSSNVETSPGVYDSNPNITGSNCTFLDPGIYDFPAGFKDNGGLISNELRPPDEAMYSNMSQRAGSGGNGYIQFWRNNTSCDGSFSVAPVTNGAGGEGLTNGTWSVVVTAAREDAFNATYPTGSSYYYPRSSAPSMCRAVSVSNSGNQGFQVAISNVPGAQWYNVYAFYGSCPTDSNYSRFGYVGSVCSGSGALDASAHTYNAAAGCSVKFTETNSGTCPSLPSWPGSNAQVTPTGPQNNSSCGLGYTVSQVFNSTNVPFTASSGSVCPTTPGLTPDYPGTSGVSQGCEPPDAEVCPTIVGGCATPGVTSPMPPNDPAAQYQGTAGTTGDRADENECGDQTGDYAVCPANVTAGAVQFAFPNQSGACFDDEGNGGAWVFSGRQYDYIAIDSQVTTATCSGANGNKIAGGGATAWIGTTYFPNAYLTITGSSKAPVSGQVVANNLTIDGSAGVTVDYNPNLAPTPPGGHLITYP